MSIQKISPVEIASWGHPKVDDWCNPDPYSSLEDVSDTTSDKVDQKAPSPPLSDADSDTSAPDLRSRLRKRKPIHADTGRPTRSVSKNVNYKLEDDSLDLKPKNRKVTKHCHLQSGPSADRIAAQSRKSIPPARTHVIPIKRKRKVETHTPDQQEVADAARPSTSDFSDEDNIPLSEIKAELDTVKPSKLKLKRKSVFVTRQVGLVER